MTWSLLDADYCSSCKLVLTFHSVQLHTSEFDWNIALRGVHRRAQDRRGQSFRFLTVYCHVPKSRRRRESVSLEPMALVLCTNLPSKGFLLQFQNASFRGVDDFSFGELDIPR